jgi:hypothetical protein
MGPQLSGSIINMGSIVGTSGVAGAASYAAAKGGILGFTRAVAREVISRNIRVNAIAPGWIDTDLTAFLGEMKPLILAQTPMRRLGDRGRRGVGGGVSCERGVKVHDGPGDQSQRRMDDEPVTWCKLRRDGSTQQPRCSRSCCRRRKTDRNAR